MYGLPDDLDLSFLVGLKVDEVSIGGNAIVIVSGGGKGQIILEMSSAVWPEYGPDFTCDGVADDHQALLSLVSKTIEGYSALDGDLTLRFDEGHTLTLREKDYNFESYQIEHRDHPGDFLVV